MISIDKISPQFISFEGTEGVGKTTAIDNLCAYFDSQNIRYIRTREPGGSPFAETLREYLLDPKNTMTTDCELLLMFAGRSEHIHKTILPALADNQWVICDRFIDSTVAYQGFGRYDGQTAYLQKIEELIKLFVPVLPTKTFWLDLPVQTGLMRAKNRSRQDRFELEQQAFFDKVHNGLTYQYNHNRQRIVKIDATGSPDDVLLAVIDNLCK